MLELFSSGMLSLWLDMAGVQTPNSTHLAAWLDTSGIVMAGEPDPIAEALTQKYLSDLSLSGLAQEGQGVWLQSNNQLLANHQGAVPLPAASLTKVATSLAALATWGPEYQFETLVGATGPIQDGVLQGDLVVQGNGDPFFVWEEAIALGNAINQLGINRVTGNLVITGNFAMNYETDPVTAGYLLKQGIDASLWSAEIITQYANLPPGTPQPRVAIAGSVQAAPSSEAALSRVSTLLVRHRSLPLTEIVKAMNIYSNNAMAEMLATSLGGTQMLAKQAAEAARVSPEEIQLINGSGLGVENRISPRAVSAMFIAIQRYLQPHQLTVADLFPVMGRDRGTLLRRQIPLDSAVKTGTLAEVSALAGVLPTRDQGLVWFTIINRGSALDSLRRQQDILLQTLVQEWGQAVPTPATLAPSSRINNESSRLGAAVRNEIF